jgi:hypothetical protein
VERRAAEIRAQSVATRPFESTPGQVLGLSSRAQGWRCVEQHH